MLRSAKFASAIKSMATSLSPHNQQGCNAGTTSFLPACLKPPRQQHHQQAQPQLQHLQDRYPQLGRAKFHGAAEQPLSPRRRMGSQQSAGTTTRSSPQGLAGFSWRVSRASRNTSRESLLLAGLKPRQQHHQDQPQPQPQHLQDQPQHLQDQPQPQPQRQQGRCPPRRRPATRSSS
ncbi:unnamed protein product [Pylaiella littoralis]